MTYSILKENHIYYLLITQVVFICKLRTMTGQHFADHFKQIFSEYGQLDTIVSDNGPHYTSEMFKGLMKIYQLNHITSLPHYPQ